MPARDRGSRRSIDLRQCGRIRWESGEMEFGQISVPVASFIFSFSGGMLARVSWYAGMGRRGEFMTGWRRTAVPPSRAISHEARFLLNTPLRRRKFSAAGWRLGPIRWTCVSGMAMTVTWSLRRIRRFGNCR